MHTQKGMHVSHDSKHFHNISEPLVKSQETPLGCAFNLKLIIHIFHNPTYIYIYTHTHTHTHTHTSCTIRNSGRGRNDSGQLVSIEGLHASRRILDKDFACLFSASLVWRASYCTLLCRALIPVRRESPTCCL